MFVEVSILLYYGIGLIRAVFVLDWVDWIVVVVFFVFLLIISILYIKLDIGVLGL